MFRDVVVVKKAILSSARVFNFFPAKKGRKRVKMTDEDKGNFKHTDECHICNKRYTVGKQISKSEIIIM